VTAAGALGDVHLSEPSSVLAVHTSTAMNDRQNKTRAVLCFAVLCCAAMAMALRAVHTPMACGKLNAYASHCCASPLPHQWE
jgi:hypothetical protein